jgi:hypothetical protein
MNCAQRFDISSEFGLSILTVASRLIVRRVYGTVYTDVQCALAT